ncbi:MAG: FAD-binding protein, partial [Bacteroidota bacterium]
MKISNWGNYPVADAEVRSIASASEMEATTQDWSAYIARGLGRCYGDSSLGPHILSTLKLNRFLEFDAENGILSCQAGVSIAEMLDVIVPQGWFVP